jgi:hypothetical protein
MKKNVGNIDSAIRILLGVILIIVPFTVSIGRIWETILIIIGIIAFFTGAMGYCLLYTFLGINTYKVKDE